MPTVSITGREHGAELGRALQAEARTGRSGSRPGRRRRHRSGRPRSSGRTPTSIGSSPRRRSDAVLAQGGHPRAHAAGAGRRSRPAFGSMSALLVLVGHQVLGALHQGAHVLAVHPGELLGGVGDEGDPPRAALREWRIIAAGSFAPIRPGPGRPGGRRRDSARCGGPHSSRRCRRRRSGNVVVGGAHETCGVPDLADPDGVSVDPVPVQPRAVLGEVGADGADQDRAQPSCPMPKAMLAATPPRRTSRSSTRKDSETLCSWSATAGRRIDPGRSSGGRWRWSR